MGANDNSDYVPPYNFVGIGILVLCAILLIAKGVG